MAVLLQGINRKAARFQEKLDTANTAMKNMKIPEQLQRRVQNYIMSTESTLSIQMELTAFLDILSPSLKYSPFSNNCRLEVLCHIFQSSIEKNFLFIDNDDLVEYIIPMLEMQVFLPEDKIMRQGEEGRYMYFIATGDCLVQVKDTRRVEYNVRTLGRGHFFGVSKDVNKLVRKSHSTATDGALHQ